MKVPYELSNSINYSAILVWFIDLLKLWLEKICGISIDRRMEHSNEKIGS